MRRFTLLTLLLTAILSVSAENNSRPMLAQGKMWCYIYHHIEDAATGHEDSQWMVCYTLQGDTVIDGRQYMKMYRQEYRHSSQSRYYGAFREDEEGRVWQYDYLGDKKDFMLLDFSLHFDYNSFAEATPIVESIKVYDQLYIRYRYQNVRPDGSLYILGFTGVEGVGFAGKGLIHYLFEDEPDCYCDYESFEYVMGGGVYFSASDFNAPKYVQLTQEERQLVEQNNDFAFRLMREARKEDSQILSPLSITYALGMLNNGAAGKTQQEINDVLGFGEAGADAINQFCRKLLTEAPTLDQTTKVSIANTIYVNSHWDFRLQEPFVEKAQQYYDATPESRDFYDGKTMGVINQWASDHTAGLIKEILTNDEFNEDAVSYLLNALYFKGKWASPFKKENTREEPFNGGKSVPMMRKTGQYEYTANDLYQAIKLPYGNKAYQMTIFLPCQGKSIADVLSQLDGKSWLFPGSSYDVSLKLPRIETDTKVNLKPIMSALGMPTAFDPNYAEFPYFCNYSVYIEMMQQVAKIKLDEEGTEAAAVTIIGEATTGMPRTAEFHATRPFLYIISEQSTGAIFFIGQYMGDGTTGVDDTPRLNNKGQMMNDRVYNLNGQQLQTPPAHGLYIYGGRKIVK